MTRILIADDERDIAEATSEILMLYGFEVTSVVRAADIVDAVRTNAPDLVLQDAQMPGLDLAKTIEAARGASPKPLVVLLFTASVDAQRIWKPVGADGFVVKPFDAGSLVEKIRSLLANPAMHSSSTGGFHARA